MRQRGRREAVAQGGVLRGAKPGRAAPSASRALAPMSADDCRARVGQDRRQSGKVADQKVSEWLLKAECGPARWRVWSGTSEAFAASGAQRRREGAPRHAM